MGQHASTASLCLLLIVNQHILRVKFIKIVSEKLFLNASLRFGWLIYYQGSRGRVVKAMDLKSIGVSPRRFESCRLR